MKVEEAYDNIENIITYGFLPVGIRYRGHSFLMKTITDKEYRLMSFIAGSDNIDLAMYRLAYSTYMIDGANFLEDRSIQIPQLIKFYRDFPSSFFRVMVDIANKAHDTFINSIKYLEGFCYTDRSRNLWRTYMGQLPNTGSYHGIPGAANVGLCNVQENWIIVNRGMDQEDEYEMLFKLALMVTSGFAGKGAKDLGSKFDFHKKELTELREEIAKYGYDKKRVVKKKKKEQWAQPLRTREDLVRELNRQMAGKKDRHDLFINEWIDEQEKRAEDARKAAIAKQEEFKAAVNEEALETIEGSRIASPEDIQKLMEAQKKTKPGMAVPIDAYKKSDEKERVLKKLSGTVIRDKE